MNFSGNWSTEREKTGATIVMRIANAYREHVSNRFPKYIPTNVGIKVFAALPCMSVCVCVWWSASHTHTHAQTHTLVAHVAVENEVIFAIEYVAFYVNTFCIRALGVHRLGKRLNSQSQSEWGRKMKREGERAREGEGNRAGCGGMAFLWFSALLGAVIFGWVSTRTHTHTNKHTHTHTHSHTHTGSTWRVLAAYLLWFVGPKHWHKNFTNKLS